MQRLEDDEEGGYDEEESDCADGHTTDNAHSQSAVTIGTSAALDDERDHTHDHRDDRHQNRTQTLLTCLEGGILDAHALSTTFAGELGNQDCRLCQQTDKHDDTRLQVDVVVGTRQAEL